MNKDIQKMNGQKGASILIVIIILVIVIIVLNKYGYTLQSIWATIKGFLGI